MRIVAKKFAHIAALVCALVSSTITARAEKPQSATSSGKAPEDDPSASSTAPRLQDLSSYSPYERETIQNGLTRTGREIDPEPDGKIIEGVDVITLDVIEPRDPIPLRLQGIVNWFHVTTRPHFVTRELLFKTGDRYERRIAEESARNLRRLPQLSVIILVPTKGSAPDRVRMLLVTKDLWSLRLPLEYRLTSGGGLEYLEAQITEINLFGTHHQISANFNYNPDTISTGGTLIVPRIWDTRLRFVADANVIYNYRTSNVEGTFGQISYYRPLFSLATEWSYGASIAWNLSVYRRYIGSQISEFTANEAGEVACRRPGGTDDEPLPPGIPCLFRRDVQTGRIYVTRSLGKAVKHNITLSAGATRAVYRTNDLSAFDPQLAETFKSTFPRLSDTRIGATLEYETFEARFARLLDVEKMGIQEEYQFGHNFIVSVSPSYAPLRESKSVVRLFAAGAYTVPLGDGIGRAYVESQTSFEPERISDGSIDVGARIVSPRTGFGRLFFDTRLLHRYANYLNDFDTLGGNGRLRGYPSNTFAGKDLLTFNLEFRSRPFEILKAQVGGAAFYDAGDAFDGFDKLRMKHSAGLGLRVLLPQVNRIVIRGDWGFPLAAQYYNGGFPGELTITFGQAFPMPVVPTSEASTQGTTR